MLRNRKRKDANLLPFRIRNNFRRQQQDVTVPSNDDEIDNVIEIDDNEMQEQQSNHDDDIDMMQSRDEEYEDDYARSSEKDDDDNDDNEILEQRSDYDDIIQSLSEEHDDDYTTEETSSESEDGYTTSSEENDFDPLSEEKHFVDMALDEDNLPHFNGNFAPYFQDFTTAALFCWIHKHNISTNAYEDLIDIIMNQEFDKNHVVKNIRRFRTWRQHLPLLPISAKSVPISSKKTPSTSKDSKIAYQLSINDIVWHVLNNPSLVNNMYFGPGVDSETKSEYWHGTLWAESPLFGQEQLTILQGKW
jgi:hypothetical protein